MNRKMLLSAMFATGLAVLIPGLGSANDLDITGNYNCQGKNADGSTYRGEVEITKKGNTYIINWLIGGQKFNGLGILEGNVLAVSYYGNSSGVVAYRVEGDSKLVGRWTSLQLNGKVNKEVLTK
ncbi:hypothetical protein LC605_28755 [Nostoc sp. CHAB 5836]|uniref:hypothetical protein n=1 Tax=Nostoc sp. CHAB 5836 TaxID=2780404 RepID=UPI001E3A1F10|nr:hypothetical protein [Nostoc sp. CHAB 5836]MCC5619001.1 hypothetical protein [Nostoc sp. CHAB 5836]